ncbi:MAG: hypothetical protein PHF09_01350 [Candidatus Nanoarchaeia archaeon]|jgi:hypothetical protein|nr:hypothetical protein [Candidatus Nanoarchaeia archaeon]MDD4563505.1 hypothetical protein [Candidatus Nanoarchaeia archaeon]
MKKEVDNSPKKFILGIAIALVTVFFVVYLIQTFYPAPKYQDFCKNEISKFINDSKVCEEQNGFWQEYEKGNGYCDVDYYCREDYNEKKETYEKNLFVINLSLGVLVLFISFLFLANTVSTGLFGGGIILIIYGTIRYWSDLSNLLRAIMLGLTLIVLIWISYKKLK